MIRYRLPRKGWLGALAALALGVQALPAHAGTLPLWKVTDGAGHLLYLAGTMHALKSEDYPLPHALRKAFRASDRLVEELDLAQVSRGDAARKALGVGMLDKGTLADAMGKDWPEAKRLAKQAGVSLDRFSSLKPWLAAVEITDMQLVRAGYEPGLGLDMHFAKRAEARHMPVDGLETLSEQLHFLDAMKPALQRRFLLQALREAPDAGHQLQALHAAWRSGDVGKLESLEKHDFHAFPHLRHRLLAQRNERWLPTIRHCLASGRTCFVAVGIEHMVGAHGLVALMREAGDHVQQITTDEGD